MGSVNIGVGQTRKDMITTAKIDLKLKNGKVFPKGSTFDVVMMPDSTKMAIATHVDLYDGTKVRVVARLLNKYFKGFVKVKISEELAEEYMERGLVKSLTGEDVEVDGYDPDGFPSILMVAGYV